jgi:hypothetical protein
MTIYHGTQQLGSHVLTKSNVDGRWSQWLASDDIRICNLPLESKICFTVWGTKEHQETFTYAHSLKDLTSFFNFDDVGTKPIGWVAQYLTDEQGFMRCDAFNVGLWPGERANPIGVCTPNRAADAIKLEFEIERTPLPLCFDENTFEDYFPTPSEQLAKVPSVTQSAASQLDLLFSSDPLRVLSESEQEFIWIHREYALTRAEHSLPFLMQSVDWGNPAKRREARLLLRQWPNLPLEESLQLLDAHYADSTLRQFAVRCLDRISNDEFLLYLLQLVQVVKYEQRLFSPIVVFLLHRSQQSKAVAHALYFHLRAELHLAQYKKRNGLILGALLMMLPEENKDSLLFQTYLNQSLAGVCSQIKQLPAPKRSPALEESLQRIQSSFRSLAEARPRSRSASTSDLQTPQAHPESQPLSHSASLAPSVQPPRPKSPSRLESAKSPARSDSTKRPLPVRIPKSLETASDANTPQKPQKPQNPLRHGGSQTISMPTIVLPSDAEPIRAPHLVPGSQNVPLKPPRPDKPPRAAQLNQQDAFELPLSPRIKVKSILIDKCKWMGSATVCVCFIFC